MTSKILLITSCSKCHYLSTYAYLNKYCCNHPDIGLPTTIEYETFEIPDWCKLQDEIEETEDEAQE